MDWNQLIQTLDQGSYDAGAVLRQLREIGYTGPVGLQCYNLKGDQKDNLQRSMAAWRRLNQVAVPAALKRSTPPKP
jgi:sugar phosphate isomerase/epimerase